MNDTLIIINILLISSSIFQSLGQGVGKARKMTFLRENVIFENGESAKNDIFWKYVIFPKAREPQKTKSITPYFKTTKT